MNNSLQSEFNVDKENSTVNVIKAFASPLQTLWDAFTKQEMLDQWWAPKPWVSKTKYMHFEEGGRRFYAMVGPEGQEHWSIQDFKSIVPGSSFGFFDAFTDKDEHISREMPTSEWNLRFSEENNVTTVNIFIKQRTADDLEKLLQTGFQEGFTKTLNYLGDMPG